MKAKGEIGEIAEGKPEHGTAKPGLSLILYAFSLSHVFKGWAAQLDKMNQISCFFFVYGTCIHLLTLCLQNL